MIIIVTERETQVITRQQSTDVIIVTERETQVITRQQSTDETDREDQLINKGRTNKMNKRIENKTGI